MANADQLLNVPFPKSGCYVVDEWVELGLFEDLEKIGLVINIGK